MDASQTIIMKNIESYIKEKHKDENYDDFELKINQIDGMTNKNYQITYYNKNDKNKKYEVLYRKYGDILDLCEHDKEIYIINYLSNKKEGPNILYSSSDYRIEEFVKESKQIPLELRYDKTILEKIINILSNYPSISNIYKYSLNPELKLELYYNNNENNNEKNYVFPTLLNICDKLFNKAKEKYEVFTTKFGEFFSKNELKDNIKTMKEKFDFYMNDYKNKFLSLFPKKGFFILCHNDCHRWNFLYKEIDKKLIIIDHEYSCYALPGLDLCNYFNENSFYFYENGNYEFKKEEINIEVYFEEYQKYIKQFIKLNENWINKEENKEFVDLIKSKEYYLNLHSITNVFWFLFCIINLDFDDDIINKTSHYFEYGYDRLTYAELVKKK